MRWLLFSVVCGALLAGAIMWKMGTFGFTKEVDPPDPDKVGVNLDKTPAQVNIGQALHAVAREPIASRQIVSGKADPIVINDCHLIPVQTQEVPARHEGTLLCVGYEVFPNATDSALKADPKKDTPILIPRVLRELKPSELVTAPKDKVILRRFEGKEGKGETDHYYLPVGERDTVEPNHFIVDFETHYFRDLKIGDHVKRGQVVGIIDPRIAIDELANKATKLNAKEADRVASEKTAAEAKERYNTLLDLKTKGRGIIPDEDVRGAQLTWVRYVYEEVGKRGEVAVAERELAEAVTMLSLHEIRSEVNGEIKVLYKHRGESVKALDPVMQVHNEEDLQLEGYVGVQFRDVLAENRNVVIEPRLQMPHEKVFSGHRLDINGVAVSGNAQKPVVVSGGEDGTVRVWDPDTKQELTRFVNIAPVKSVACTPPSSSLNLCAYGCTDGTVRLIDLDKLEGKPEAKQLSKQHRGPIHCIAFSPDGQYMVTGGDDKNICMWNVKEGKFMYAFPTGHMGAVTSLQFIQQGDGADGVVKLVSAGRDNTMLLWKPGTENAQLESARIERRSGDVPVLGASPDGEQVVFDRGRELRLVSVKRERTEAVLENAGASSFSVCALFSPDNRMLLTADGTEGRLQLWRLPEGLSRGSELEQFVWSGAPTTCACFSPHTAAGKRFVVSGTRDGSVALWRVPGEDQLKRQITGQLSLLSTALENSAGKIKIRADITENPGYKLLAGNTATVVVYPK